MSEHALELEARLREKEELVEALTERLELAAEQLDRLKRANGDRGHWLAGGIPAELVEQQKTACEDLGRIVQQWEESQPTATLSRIEMQLQELRDLVVQSPGVGSVLGEPRRHSAEQSVDSTPPGQSAWDALKAGLLEPAVSGGDDQDSTGPDESLDANPFDGDPLEIPPAIDLDLAEPEELRNAVNARDGVIAELLRRLRAAEARSRPSDHWKTLEAAPEPLRLRLESLERRLEQTLRLAEVELSLERARLGREAARLKQLEESSQKVMERIGLAVSEDEDDLDDLATNAADSRWLRMLGIKR